MAQANSLKSLGEMTAAPPLPLLDETPIHCLPADFADGADPAPLAPPQRPLLAPAVISTHAQTIHVLTRAAALQRSFVTALAGAQAEYLAVMTEIGQRLGTQPGHRIAAAEPVGDAALAAAYTIKGDEIYVDLERAPWLRDHRPDYGAAVLPMTFVAEIIAASAQTLAPELKVVKLSDVALRRWIVVTDKPLRIRRQVERRADGTITVTLYIWRDAARAELSRDEAVASGIVRLAAAYPEPLPVPAPLSAVMRSPDPYETATLFHGPAFQLVKELWSGAEGAGAVIDAGGTSAPKGLLHPILIDTILQAGADMRWDDWCPEAILESGKGLPLKLADVTFYGPTPRDGIVHAEMRAAGLEGGPRFPVLNYCAFADGRMWMSARLVAVGVPLGPMDNYPSMIRRAHLRDRAFMPNVRYSTVADGETVLSDDTVALANWIPGTVETVYDIAPGTDVTRAAALKEHAARLFAVHPFDVALEGDTAHCKTKPGTALNAIVAREGGRVRVRTG